jgi:thiol-disulfide isomerase/thioredoxin
MNSIGVATVVVVLIVGTVVGAWRRRTDGRLRDSHAQHRPGRTTAAAAHIAASPAPPGTGPVADVAEKTGAELAEETGADVAEDAGAVEEGQRVGLDGRLLERLGVGPAEATLLQFSSAFCAPCRAVRRVSSEVAGLLPGVRHIEVDAESHLDEVRELGIWRTPTLLVLDAHGREIKRATGVPSKPQLIAALAGLLPQRDAPGDGQG